MYPSDVSIICQTHHRSDVSVRCIDHMSDASSVTYIRRMYYIRQTNRSSLFLRIINPKINPFFQPANILLDEHGHVRISDLGLACDFSKRKPHASV